MAKIKGSGLGQRVVADYAPGVQPRIGRIYRLVWRSAEAGGIYESGRSLRADEFALYR